MTSEEFGKSSLRELHELTEQWKARERAKYWRTASIVSMIHNTNVDKKSKARDIEYFMPEAFREKRKRKPWQEMLMAAKAVTASINKD